MPREVVSSAWHKSNRGEFSSCPGPNRDRVGRKRKGGPFNDRAYNHYCVDIKIDTNGNVVTDHDDMSYKKAPFAHHPCLNLGESTLIGGGTDANGNWNGYEGKADIYDNAEFAFKCTIPDAKVEQNIKAWSVSSHTTTARAKDDKGYKNLWEQIIFGVKTPHVNQDGYCSKIDNLDKQVHNDGRKCKDMIAEALTKSLGKQLCKNTPTDPRCACINISEYGTMGCLQRPNLPGCKELKAGFDKFPGNAQTEVDPELWTPLCFMTDPCPRSDQFTPDARQVPCNQTIAICKQEQNLYANTIQAGANVSFKSEMECTAESTQGSSSGGGGGGGDGDEEEIAIPKSLDELKLFFPKSLDELKTNRKKQIGVGGAVSFIVLILMCLIAVVVASSS